METFYPVQGCRNGVVLVVEDEKLSRKAMGMLLAESGYTAETFESAEEAIEAIQREGVPGFALVDLDLPGMNGAELIAYLAQTAPTTQSVLVTARQEEDVEHLASQIKYLRKPIDFKDLLRTLATN